MSLLYEAVEGYHTPEGSEVDELEHANTVAAELFYLARIKRVKEPDYRRCAEWLDTIPGAGEFFRCISAHEFSDEEWELWQWKRAWYKEMVAQREQSLEIGWRAKQWFKQPKKVRRVKRWR